MQTPPSEDAFIPVCRGWVAQPRTAPHPASTNHCEKQATNKHKRHSTVPAVQESSLPGISSSHLSHLLLLITSCVYHHCSTFLRLFANIQLPFPPAQEAAPVGAAAAIAHNSPNECQPEVICRHQVDYCFLREWERKRGAQA